METEKDDTAGLRSGSRVVEQPVSMYVLFAKMFCITARRMEERLGEEGLEIMAQAVREFGQERGKDIARRARENGNENDLEHYLGNYDMERSELFDYQDVYEDGAVHQVFNRCIFADTWMKEGRERYGRIYCENIDPSIAWGYNEMLMCVHDKMMYDDGECTFCFKMK